MKIAISGAGGFIGTALSQYLEEKGHEVSPVSRTRLQLGVDQLAGFLEGIDAVINLAGYPVISRWTEKNRSLIYDSRILTTQMLVKAIQQAKHPPSLLISASAIGIYKSPGKHTEASRDFDSGFLGDVCRDWEAEAGKAGCRVVVVRTGIVLDKSGGALKSMLLPFQLGLGGPIATGSQGFSWIHLKDVLGAINHLIQHVELKGVFNLTAPNPVSNKDFAKALGRVLHRPALLPTPAFVLQLIYGKGAEALTRGSFVIPERLLESGYNYQYPALDGALKNIFR